jgi:hypothetical protein
MEGQSSSLRGRTLESGRHGCLTRSVHPRGNGAGCISRRGRSQSGWSRLEEGCSLGLKDDAQGPGAGGVGRIAVGPAFLEKPGPKSRGELNARGPASRTLETLSGPWG